MFCGIFSRNAHLSCVLSKIILAKKLALRKAFIPNEKLACVVLSDDS